MYVTDVTAQVLGEPIDSVTVMEPATNPKPVPVIVMTEPPTCGLGDTPVIVGVGYDLMVNTAPVL